MAFAGFLLRAFGHGAGRAAIALLPTLLLACAQPLDAEAPLAEARPVAVPAGTAAQLSPLRVEAALVLRSPDRRFGGLSGLLLTPDGQGLLAVSDRGLLWRARLKQAPDERLLDLADWSVQPIAGQPGEPNGARSADAEALAWAGPDQIVVASEGVHRLRRLRLADPAAAPAPLPTPPGLGAPHNLGIEALAELSDGRWLALTEGVRAGQGLAAWRIGPARIEPMAYRPAAGFAPTGADRLGDRLYLVERRLSFLGGLETRLVVLPEAALGADRVLEGQELARFRWGELGENMEGIVAHRAADGRVLLYLLADDNFSPAQHTLLLQLSLDTP